MGRFVATGVKGPGREAGIEKAIPGGGLAAGGIVVAGGGGLGGRLN